MSEHFIKSMLLIIRKKPSQQINILESQTVYLVLNSQTAKLLLQTFLQQQ